MSPSVTCKSSMATLHMILKILSFPFSLPRGYHWMLILGSSDDKRGDNDDSSNDQAQVFSLLLLSWRHSYTFWLYHRLNILKAWKFETLALGVCAPPWHSGLSLMQKMLLLGNSTLAFLFRCFLAAVLGGLLGATGTRIGRQDPGHATVRVGAVLALNSGSRVWL